ATTKSRTGPDDWRSNDESGPTADALDRSGLARGGRGVRRQEAAGGATDAAAASSSEFDIVVTSAGAAAAGFRADDSAARAGARRCHFVRVARRLEQELSAEAGVLRARQQRTRPGVVEDPGRERRAPEALLHLGGNG